MGIEAFKTLKHKTMYVIAQHGSDSSLSGLKPFKMTREIETAMNFDNRKLAVQLKNDLNKKKLLPEKLVVNKILN